MIRPVAPIPGRVILGLFLGWVAVLLVLAHLLADREPQGPLGEAALGNKLPLRAATLHLYGPGK